MVDSSMPINLDYDQLQREVRVWADGNFDTTDPLDPLLGMIEELGELCHAVLKMRQGIRGTVEEHFLAARDALGDMEIYRADFIGRMGWSSQEIVQDTWNQVSKRNWKDNPLSGSPA